MGLLHTAVMFAVMLSLTSAVPPGKKDARVMDLDIADAPQGGEEYDHQAFLGKDMAKLYEKLTPEQVEDVLGDLFDQLDINKDGKASKEEMGHWIKKMERRSSVHQTRKTLREKFPNQPNKDHITFEEFEMVVYGRKRSKNEALVKRDRRRWNACDDDGDGILDINEYTDYNNPGEAEKLQDLIVLETLEEIDPNMDGYISEDEYIEDFIRMIKKGEDDHVVDPEAIAAERQHFRKERDTDGDGRLSKKEVRHWLLPGEDTVKHEVDHLLDRTDDNKDGSFEKAEVIKHKQFFIGSGATGFGEAILAKYKHSEF